MTVLSRSIAEPAQRWPLPRSTWQRLAACAGREDALEIYFPEDGIYTQARAICSSCLVIDKCRALADRVERGVPAGMIFGMFAGETPAERVARRRG